MGPPGRVASTWRRLGGLLPLLVAALLLTATILAATLAPRHFQSLVQADRTALDEVVGPARTLVSELQASLDREAASVSGYLLDRDIGHKERYRQAREREDSLVLQLAPLARRLGTPAVAQLDDLRRRMTEWHEDQEQLLLGVPGFAPEYLRRLPAQEARYAGVRLATERLDGTLATAESVRRARIEELRRLEPPVMRGLAWLAGAAVLATLLMAGRLVMLSGRPQRGVLEASERRFGELAGSIREVFWIRDAETGRFTYISPAYEDVWGRSREPLHAGFGPFLATVHPEDRDRVEAAEPPGEIEYRIVRPDGTIRWIAERSLRLSDERERKERWLGVAADVTERFEARQHLAHLALHDPVTGLGNHLLLLDRLEHAVARARRSGHAVAVLVVHIDDLRSVNEAFGQAGGDRVLGAVAERLRGIMRQEDTLVRLADDAFMAVLERVGGRADLLKAAARISDGFETPFAVNGEQIELGARVVAAISDAAGLTPADIARLADGALHRPSRESSARIADGASASVVEAGGGRSGESHLRRALQEEQFRVLYQPVLDLRTEGLMGLEALLRWDHPERGLLAPAEFMGLAAESGLVHPLGLFVLRRVCADLGAWASAPSPLRDAWVSVNLSARQFELPDFVEQVAHILDRAGVLPDRLRVEVDEATWFRARHALQRLRELGVMVAVDGFGDRYGALGALRRLPVDGIKLNRRLGFGPFAGESASSPVASFAGLASGLGLEVTAVGIESVGELTGLKILGCDAGQGYLFSPPLGGDALREWAARDSGRRRRAELS